jgi:cell division septum initiation protein DivIVA
MWRRLRKAEPEDPTSLGPEFDNRVDAILDDVRAEADRILDEARRKAEGTTSDIDEALAYRRKRLLELYETLIARAEMVLARLDDVEHGRDSLGRMIRALSQAADELSRDVEAGEPAPEPGMATAAATRAEVDKQLRELSAQPGEPPAGDPE